MQHVRPGARYSVGIDRSHAKVVTNGGTSKGIINKQHPNPQIGREGMVTIAKSVFVAGPSKIRTNRSSAATLRVEDTVVCDTVGRLLTRSFCYLFLSLSLSLYLSLLLLTVLSAVAVFSRHVLMSGCSSMTAIRSAWSSHNRSLGKAATNVA